MALSRVFNCPNCKRGEIAGPSVLVASRDRSMKKSARTHHAPRKSCCSGRSMKTGLARRRRTTRPAKVQVAAYQRLPQDDTLLDTVLANYLLMAATSGPDIGGVQIPEPADFDEPEQRQRLTRLRTTEGIRELFHLDGITIVAESKAGLAYVRFEYEPEFDPEHGVAIVVHGTTPVGIGQVGDDDLGLPVGSREDEVVQPRRTPQRVCSPQPRPTHATAMAFARYRSLPRSCRQSSTLRI